MKCTSVPTASFKDRGARSSQGLQQREVYVRVPGSARDGQKANSLYPGTSEWSLIILSCRMRWTNAAMTAGARVYRTGTYLDFTLLFLSRCTSHSARNYVRRRRWLRGNVEYYRDS